MAYYYSPFRNNYQRKLTDGCAFCDTEKIMHQAVRDKSGRIMENNYYIWLVNFFPKFEGHTLLVPKRHLISLQDESLDEILSRNKLMQYAVTVLERLYPDSGVEIFLQYGPGSAASISHIHWHIVPAMCNDELRSFEKLGHFYTTDQGKERVLLFPLKIDKAKEDLQTALSQVISN